MRKALQAWMLAAALVPAALVGQDLNVTRPAVELERLLAEAPKRIVSAEISRPKAKGDITLKADVSFGGAPPLRVKLRKASPAPTIPSTTSRATTSRRTNCRSFSSILPSTWCRPRRCAWCRWRTSRNTRPASSARFRGADQVLAVVQYWLSDIKVVEDVYDPARFAADPVYARHIGQLNVLTYLIGIATPTSATS